jgi:hypothetical protein
MRDVSGAWTELPYPVTGDSWTAGALTPGHTYEFQLLAVNGLQRGTLSNVARVAVPLPAPVSRLTATPGRYSATLSWTPQPGADGYFIDMATSSDGQIPPARSAMTKLPYPVMGKTSLDVLYLFGHGIYWFEVVTIKNGAEAPQTWTNMDSTQVYIDNPDYLVAKGAYLTGSPVREGAQAGLYHVPTDHKDRGIVVVRAYIRSDDWLSTLITDVDFLTSRPTTAGFAPARAHFAWDSASGTVGVAMQPSCPPPLRWPCKPALDLRHLNTPPPTPHDECGDGVFTPCPSLRRSYNDIYVHGTGNGAVQIDYSVADSFTTIPGTGAFVPGGIDGALTLLPNGAKFSGSLIADKYPSYEIVHYPHYTLGGFPTATMLGTRTQALIEQLCTACSGQTETRF